jgi:hypothetical protein
MKRRAVEWCVDDVDAGAHLIGVDILKHLIETQAGIQRHLARDFPFVLHVDPKQPTQLRGRVKDIDRRADTAGRQD